LAAQQAHVLGFLDYQEMDADELASAPPQLTICLNSLLKLGFGAGLEYDYIILDGCGLIRRHFLSSTMHRNLEAIYNKFKGILRDAKSVIMLQEGVSKEDAQFFTEIDNVDCESRLKVHAIHFKRPSHIHPIKVTSEFYFALFNLKKHYRDSITNGGGCENPFMVFVNSCAMAEFLVHVLRAEALAVGGEPDRIKGIWSRIKRNHGFCRNFSKEPNRYAREADVVVATSVIGAGFSISSHFHAFHGFFFTNILMFEEEKQFIQRLRFLMDDLPVGAVRQSYLHVERGRGTSIDYQKVVTNFVVLRKIMLMTRTGRRSIQPSAEPLLAETQARIETEKAAACADHDKLWREYGEGTLDSDWQELDVTCDDNEKKALRKQMSDYLKTRRKDISAHVKKRIWKIFQPVSPRWRSPTVWIYSAWRRGMTL
jgi:hypothetical protein